MRKVDFFVCPDCGRIVTATGPVQVSCCGIVLKPLEDKSGEGKHILEVEDNDGIVCLSCPHGMTTEHHMMFVAYVTDTSVLVFEQMPEKPLHASFKKQGNGKLYYYCNTHGLYSQTV